MATSKHVVELETKATGTGAKKAVDSLKKVEKATDDLKQSQAELAKQGQQSTKLLADFAKADAAAEGINKVAGAIGKLDAEVGAMVINLGDSVAALGKLQAEGVTLSSNLGTAFGNLQTAAQSLNLSVQVLQGSFRAGNQIMEKYAGTMTVVNELVDELAIKFGVASDKVDEFKQKILLVMNGLTGGQLAVADKLLRKTFGQEFVDMMNGDTEAMSIFEFGFEKVSVAAEKAGAKVGEAVEEFNGVKEAAAAVPDISKIGEGLIKAAEAEKSFAEGVASAAEAQRQVVEALAASGNDAEGVEKKTAAIEKQTAAVEEGTKARQTRESFEKAGATQTAGGALVLESPEARARALAGTGPDLLGRTDLGIRSTGGSAGGGGLADGSADAGVFHMGTPGLSRVEIGGGSAPDLSGLRGGGPSALNVGGAGATTGESGVEFGGGQGGLGVAAQEAQAPLHVGASGLNLGVARDANIGPEQPGGNVGNAASVARATAATLAWMQEHLGGVNPV